MRIDHIAYRVKDRCKTVKFFQEALDYAIADEFEIKFINHFCYYLNTRFKASNVVEHISNVSNHIAPEMLNQAYERLFDWSSKYLCIVEYYNPTPVSISYRGHQDKLYKRDFAGDLLEKYPALTLIDYGFVYHNDNTFPLDDVSWFLLEKK